MAIQQSLSRPHVSNDNPHPEAGFKNFKYHPTYPDRFNNLQHAQTWMREFEQWYCYEHHHTALGRMTPAAVHFGTAEALWLKRQAVLQAAYHAHPKVLVGANPSRRVGRSKLASTPRRPWTYQESASRTTLYFFRQCPKLLNIFRNAKQCIIPGDLPFQHILFQNLRRWHRGDIHQGSNENSSCLIPPRENRLKVPIWAGEKSFRE